MSPWWLRPPAEEPAGDEKWTDGRELGEPQGGALPPGEAVEKPRQKGGEVAAEAPSSGEGTPSSEQKSPRRRSRRGHGRRALPESAKARVEPRPPRPRRRGREGPAVSDSDTGDPGAVSAIASENGAEMAVASRDRPPLEDRRLAVICDLESLALGVRESGVGRFELELIFERLLDKGKIIVKRAYADWDRHREYKRSFQQAGVELVDVPAGQLSGKSETDVRIAVDVMELCYSKQHLDTFVLLSGDGALIPLVSKLKENNKHVIGVGSLSSSPQLLIDNCDEFLGYEDVVGEAQEPPDLEGVDGLQREAFSLLVEAVQALTRENQQVLWGSVVKQAIQRKHPSFMEGHYGYSSFSKMLERAQEEGIVMLRKDQRSGSYVVTGFARK